MDSLESLVQRLDQLEARLTAVLGDLDDAAPTVRVIYVSADSNHQRSDATAYSGYVVQRISDDKFLDESDGEFWELLYRGSFFESAEEAREAVRARAGVVEVSEKPSEVGDRYEVQTVYIVKNKDTGCIYDDQDGFCKYQPYRSSLFGKKDAAEAVATRRNEKP